MLIYIATFYTMSPMGLRMIILSFTELFTGALIPLPFFPDGLRQAVEYSPFGGMQDLPLRVYSGNLAGGGALDPARLASRVDRRAAGAGPGLDASGAARSDCP